MSVKLFTDHPLEFLSLNKAAKACLSLHLSKWQIVGNHMSRLIYQFVSWLVDKQRPETVCLLGCISERIQFRNSLFYHKHCYNSLEKV